MGESRSSLSLSLSAEVEPGHLASPAGYRTDSLRSPSHIRKLENVVQGSAGAF